MAPCVPQRNPTPFKSGVFSESILRAVSALVSALPIAARALWPAGVAASEALTGHPPNRVSCDRAPVPRLCWSLTAIDSGLEEAFMDTFIEADQRWAWVQRRTRRVGDEFGRRAPHSSCHDLGCHMHQCTRQAETTSLSGAHHRAAAATLAAMRRLRLLDWR
eukprot:362547-Chlamydomonas_euryale.AAC.2